MDEIIDLIVDFEKKTVNLAKHLWTNPKAIVESVILKEKKYLSSFKFYSLIFSVWIILIQFTNKWIEAFIENPILPKTYVEFQNSYQTFLFFVAPFTFIVAWILPFASLNYLLNRKPRFSFLTHVKLATYQGGMVLLIILPQIAIIAIWTTYFEISFENFGVYLMEFFLIVIPACFVIQFSWKNYTPKVWASLKTIMISILITAFAFRVIFESNILSFVYKNIVYSNYIRYDLGDYHPAYIKLQSALSDSISEKTNSLFSTTANIRIVYQINSDVDSVRYFLEHSTAIASKLIDLSTEYMYGPNASPRWFGEQLNDSLIFVANTCSCQNSENLNWFVNPKSGSVSSTKELPTKPSSRFSLIKKDVLLFSSTSDGTPVVVQTVSSVESNKLLLSLEDKKHFEIDNWLIEQNADSLGIQMTLFKNQSGRLEEIDYLTGEVVNGKFKTRNELTLFKNAVSPNYNFYGKPLHNSNLLKLDSISSLITYQVMTDSTFKIIVHKVDVLQGKEKWQQTFSIPADFAVYKHAFVDGGSLILLGQAATFFSKNQINNSIHNYILTIDLSTGQLTNLTFFKPTSNSLYGLEDLYLQGPAYQDDDFIYWDMYNGHDRVIIDKKVLLKVR